MIDESAREAERNRIASEAMVRPECETETCAAGLAVPLEKQQIILFMLPFLFVFATFGWAISAHASTDQSTGSETESDDKTHLAQSFANLYLPKEISIAGALDNFERQSSRTMDSDPTNALLEQKYPGISMAAITASRAVLDKGLQEDIPKIQLELSAYIGKNFSAPEIRAINQFYASSAGQSLLHGVRENLDADQLTDDMRERMKTGDGQMVIDNDAVINMAGQAAIKSLEEEHIPAIAAFMTSPAGRKFSLHTEELMGIVAQGMTVSTNRIMPEIQAAGLRAFMSFAAGKR